MRTCPTANSDPGHLRRSTSISEVLCSLACRIGNLISCTRFRIDPKLLWRAVFLMTCLSSGTVLAQDPSCRGENPTGTVECTVYPPWELPWVFRIPGPEAATGYYYSLSEAINEYKQKIVDVYTKVGWIACGGAPEAIYPVDNPGYGLFPSSSAFSGFNYGKYEWFRNTGIQFIWNARRTGPVCQNLGTLTFFHNPVIMAAVRPH